MMQTTTQKWRRLLRPIKNSAGMSMVEVLVAFAVLMLVLALANTAVHTSLNLSNMAEDVRQKTESALSGYYGAAHTAEETPCNFGDFSLKTYPGEYKDDATGYSFYWFHDGQDHTPTSQEGEYPAWLPNAWWENLAIIVHTEWSSWADWWNHVVAERPDCAERWLVLMNGRDTFPDSWRSHVFAIWSWSINDGNLCPAAWMDPLQ